MLGTDVDKNVKYHKDGLLALYTPTRKMSFFEVLLLLLSIVALVIVALLAVMAAVRVTQVAGYSGDSDLQNAHKYFTWASVVAWIAVVVIIILLSFYVSKLNVSADEGSVFSSELWVRVFIFVAFALAVALAVLIFIGITDTNKSSLSDRAKSLSVQTFAGWGGGIALGTALAILIAFFFSLYNEGRKYTGSTTTPSTEAKGKKVEPEEAKPTGGIPGLPTGGSGALGEAEGVIEANPELLLA